MSCPGLVDDIRELEEHQHHQDKRSYERRAHPQLIYSQSSYNRDTNMSLPLRHNVFRLSFPDRAQSLSHKALHHVYLSDLSDAR